MELMGLEVSIADVAIIIGVILFSMTLHEVMHGLVAYWLGDDTAKSQGRLTLNPIKHIDPFLTILLPVILALTPGAPIFGGAKPVPFNPMRVKYGEWGAALVAAAGPLVNLLIAFVVFGLYTVTGASGTAIGHVMGYAIMVNLGFFVFNLLPIPPLDGSRVIYALAPDFIRRGMAAMEGPMGIMFVFMIVMLAGSVVWAIMSSSIGAIIHVFEVIFGV